MGPPLAETRRGPYSCPAGRALPHAQGHGIASVVRLPAQPARASRWAAGGSRAGSAVGQRRGVGSKRHQLLDLLATPRRDRPAPVQHLGGERRPRHPLGPTDLGPGRGPARDRSAPPANTGHRSFSTTPPCSATYENSGSTSRSSPTVTPSSSRARRRAAASSASPGPGCPQTELVHTPGKVALIGARWVTSSAPSGSKRYAEKARCRGVVAVVDGRLVLRADRAAVGVEQDDELGHADRPSSLTAAENTHGALAAKGTSARRATCGRVACSSPCVSTEQRQVAASQARS